MAREQDIEAFINARKEGWSKEFRNDPGQAAQLLRKYGKSSTLDAVFQGLQQGASHGFADEVERATTGGPAKNHILAKASEPVAYMLAQILGLAGTGSLVRGAGGAIGKARSAPLRRGGSAVAAGGQRRAMETAERARDIEKTWANFPFGRNTDQRVRGFALDAAHGAALGYGGVDPTRDEDLLSTDRAGHAGVGLLASLLLAPMSVSAGAAATNLPLLMGGRRIGSKKMLEPPGVTRQNPRGNPRLAIEIARAKDESAARGRMPQDTADDAIGIIQRDTARPIDSDAPNIRRVADLALEPVARDRIASLRRSEMDDAAAAMERAYPMPQQGGQRPAIERAKDIARAMREESEQAGGRFRGEVLGDAGGKVKTPRLPGAEDLARQRAARGERPDPLADMREAQLMREAMRREAMDARREAMGARPVQGELALPPPQNRNDEFVDQMLEAVVRQDAPALASWMSTLQQAAKRDPKIMPVVQARVARVLAINERSNPGLNDTREMGQFLHALGMSGNKAKGIPNVIEAARAGPRQQYNSGRYQEAEKRLGTKGARVRPRHAEALREEMANYTPPAYTGPWDRRMGEPLVLRGDDRARFLSPWDFYRKGKATEQDVTMSGLASGPFALAGDALYNRMTGKSDTWRDQPPPPPPPQLPVIEGQAREVVTQPPPPAGLLEQLAPREAGNPVLEQASREAAAEKPRTREADLDTIKQIQAEMISVGYDVGGPNGEPDGVIGRKTLKALELFTQGADMPLEAVLEKMRSFPRAYLARILQTLD